MDYTEKEMLVNRIVSGVHIYEICGSEYIVRPPTRIEKYKGDNIYKKTLVSARRIAISEDSLNSMMKIRGYWTDQDEVDLKKLIEQLDKMKIILYENFDKDDASQIRKKIKLDKEGIEELTKRKYEYSSYTDEWVATCAKQRYLLSCSVGSDLESIIDIVLTKMREEAISESQFRELARSEPWRNIWESREVGNLFDVPVCDLTNDQRRLVLYSLMYDRIYEHHERPSEDIIEDDDALDGWKLIQKQKVHKDKIDRQIEEKLSNNKIAGAQEVIIPISNDDELKAVNGLNDAGAKIVKRNREVQVSQKGAVAHEDFIDQQLLIREGLRGRA